MPSYSAPLTDIRFVLCELLGVDKMSHVTRYAEMTDDALDAILTEAGRFCAEVAAPLNLSGDAEGCTLADGVVHTPQGFKQAYRTYAEAGWVGLHSPSEFGGQGLPPLIGLPVVEMLTAANCSFSSYPGLTAHAVTPIEHFATQELKDAYLPKMISGEWTGTMNLTEPHCGSDLGLLRTRATPTGDGAYRINGTKIFITAGDHDLTENIVHLVLARIDGAPSGVRGISLFIVPKFLPDADGKPSIRNGVRCQRIENKMGIHGSATCELGYTDAVGFLVGQEHRGLQPMFTMMNEARIGAGIQGVALAEVAYQNAVAYARTRLQGRAPVGSLGNGPDPIILHPDVRRMLLSVRAFVEMSRALCYWSGVKADLAALHPDPGVRKIELRKLEVLTPIVKAWPTEYGFNATYLAMQCFGGHGYVHEWGVEQFVRDVRITSIYEGTNGVQAMDLVSRKIIADNGEGAVLLFNELEAMLDPAEESIVDSAMLAAAKKAVAAASQATEMLVNLGRDDAEYQGFVAAEYLSVMALACCACLGVRSFVVARRKLDEGLATGDAETHLTTKLEVTRFFFASFMPMLETHMARIALGPQPLRAIPVEAY